MTSITPGGEGGCCPHFLFSQFLARQQNNSDYQAWYQYYLSHFGADYANNWLQQQQAQWALQQNNAAKNPLNIFSTKSNISSSQPTDNQLDQTAQGIYFTQNNLTSSINRA